MVTEGLLRAFQSASSARVPASVLVDALEAQAQLALGVPTGVSEADDKRETGRRLALLETMSGRTQQELAQQFGLTKQKWGRYRNGESNLPVPLARAIRDRFGCSL